MTKASRTDPQVNFRMPSELLDQIKADAKANGRSMNAEIIARLEGSTETLSVRDQVAGLALIGAATVDRPEQWSVAKAFKIADMFEAARSEPSR